MTSIPMERGNTPGYIFTPTRFSVVKRSIAGHLFTIKRQFLVGGYFCQEKICAKNRNFKNLKTKNYETFFLGFIFSTLFAIFKNSVNKFWFCYIKNFLQKSIKLCFFLIKFMDLISKKLLFLCIFESKCKFKKFEILSFTKKWIRITQDTKLLEEIQNIASLLRSLKKFPKLNFSGRKSGTSNDYVAHN